MHPHFLGPYHHLKMSEIQTGAGNLKTLKTLKMILGTCLCSKVAFYTRTPDIRVHRAGSQLKMQCMVWNLHTEHQGSLTTHSVKQAKMKL